MLRELFSQKNILSRYPARSRKKWIMVLLALTLLILFGEIAYLGQNQTLFRVGFPDFVEYWGAGQLLLRGENPYDPVLLYQVEQAAGWDGPSPVMMWNPPWTLVLMLPIILLSFPLAAFIWLFLNLGGLLICSSALWNVLTPEDIRERIWISWLSAVLFSPALFTLRIGQISIVILLGTAGFILLASKGRDTLAGICLAITMIKPHLLYLLYIVVLWWILRERRWRVLSGLISTMALLVGLLLLISPNILPYYWQAISQTLPLYWRTATLGAVLRGLYGAEFAWLQFFPALVAAFSVVVFLLYRRPTVHWPNDALPILLISIPTSMYGWSFDQVILLPIYLQIVAWVFQRKEASRLSRWLLAGGLILMNGVLLLQNQLKIDDLFFFWPPLALGLLYLYGLKVLELERPILAAGESR